MHVPLVLGDRVYGVVSVNSPHPRAFGERELKVMDELALHAASALQNALQFEQERHVAEILQQALLAEELPQVAGLELAALYQPSAGSEVGGDFYSAWPLADGRLAILVGDVSGKGVEAAGVTAMVRYMAEALSQHSPEPAALVAELNDLLCARMADGALVTLVLAVVDRGRDGSSGARPATPRRCCSTRTAASAPSTTPTRPAACSSASATTRPRRPSPPATCWCSTPTASSRRAARPRVRRGGAAPTPCSRPPTRRPTASPAWCTSPPAPGRGGRLSDDVAIAVVRRTPASNGR